VWLTGEKGKGKKDFEKERGVLKGMASRKESTKKEKKERTMRPTPSPIPIPITPQKTLLPREPRVRSSANCPGPLRFAAVEEVAVQDAARDVPMAAAAARAAVAPLCARSPSERIKKCGEEDTSVVRGCPQLIDCH